MLYYVTLFNLFLGFISKKKKLISLLLLSNIIVLFGLNSYNVDYMNYYNMYNYLYKNNYTGNIKEPGYNFIANFFVYFNFSYEEFLFIISLIVTIILYFSIIKYTDNVNIVLSLFIIYPLGINIIQFRFFIAMTVVLFSLRYLEEFNKKNIVFFVFCILLASSIHYISFIYILLLLLYFNLKNKNNIFLFFLSFIFISIAIYFFGNYLFDTNIKYNFNYQLEYTSIFRILLFKILLFIIIAYIKRYVYLDFSIKFLLEILLFLNFITIFLEFLTPDFERITRINYIILFIILSKIGLKYKNIKVISYIYIVFYIFYQYYFRGGQESFYEIVVINMFENNHINNYF